LKCGKKSPLPDEEEIGEIIIKEGVMIIGYDKPPKGTAHR